MGVTYRIDIVTKLIAVTGLLGLASPPAFASGGDTIQLTGIVRDFRSVHPDFDIYPSEGWGHCVGNVAPALSDDGRPVYTGGGYKVGTQYMDSANRPICWTLYDPDLGDTEGTQDAPSNGGITSAATFDQWFRDVPGVNLSAAVTVTGVMQEYGQYAGMYEVNVPSFYPIDGRLFGDENSGHNRFFTFVIAADYTHDSTKNYELMFKSDDDLWVFVDGKLVSDLGGMNGSPEQWVDLNRLGLVDGQQYRIHMFKTNRSEASRSRLHLVTNIPLTSVEFPTISAAFD